MNNNQYLFIFTIGPVQSFIAQARKTQDLYAGSQILSALIKAAIKSDKQIEHNIVFPVLDKTDKNQSLPNRFVVIVNQPESQLNQLGKNVEDIVRKKFREIAQNIFDKKVPKRIRKNDTEDLFLNQINRHLDIHWVFSPLIEGDYSNSYKQAEALLGSVKNVRPFEQFGGGLGEAGRKCSLDGENNALFFGKDTSPRFFKQKWNPFAVELQEDHVFLAQNEGLSAVSFVKRFGLSTQFPSTTEIALSESLSKLESKSIEDYKDVFRHDKIIEVCEEDGKLRMNGKAWTSFNEQFYYEENLIEKYIPCKAQLNKAKERHKKLQNTFRKKEVKFDKYYALVLFDGDRMGEKLSKAKKFEQHQDFSKLLTDFGKEAREIVDKHGQTVYAGGDDFLGFVNLHHLFEVMTKLRTSFEGSVSKGMKEVLGIGEDFTFSAGIVIAHYKMPLAEVLKTVRKMEKKAKKEGGRNAFCITSMKHSGEVQETAFKWGTGNQHWEALQYITQQLSNSVFSNKFIANLTVELYQLAGVKLKDVGKVEEEAIFTEFERLLKRGLIDKTKKNRIPEMVEKLKVLYQNKIPNDKFKKRFRGIENFVHALQIADFLST